VSQVGNLRSMRALALQRSADYQSAIQQIAILRYVDCELTS